MTKYLSTTYSLVACLTTLSGIPISIIWYVEKISMEAGLILAGLIICAPTAVWLWHRFNKIDAMCAAQSELSREAAPSAAVAATHQLPISTKSESIADEAMPTLLPEMALGWQDPPFFTPPRYSDGQELYREAFEAMASGRILVANRDTLVRAAEEVGHWVDKQCHLLLEAWPGTDRKTIKARFYELAFERIKSGDLMSSDIARIMVPVVERYVHAKFSKDL